MTFTLSCHVSLTSKGSALDLSILTNKRSLNSVVKQHRRYLTYITFIRYDIDCALLTFIRSYSKECTHKKDPESLENDLWCTKFEI